MLALRLRRRPRWTASPPRPVPRSAMAGALLFLDLNPDAPRPDGQPGPWTASEISGGLDAGTDATEMLTGLGFAMSFQRATHIQLDCPELITGGSVGLDLKPGAQSTPHADQV